MIVIAEQSAIPVAGRSNQKMECHPNAEMRIPPINGPSARPVYTTAVFIPITFPRSWRGKFVVRSGIATEKTMALPSPPSAIPMRRMSKDVDSPAMKNPRNWKEMPAMNMFCFPILSDILPNGKRNIAYAIRKLVCTHPICAAGIAKSEEINGRAMFTPEDIKGVANEAREAVKRSLMSSVRVSWDDCEFCGPFSVSMFINP